jgi:hypothetical protein
MYPLEGWIFYKFVWFCIDYRRSLDFESLFRGGRSFILLVENKPKQTKGQPMLALRVPCTSRWVWTRQKLANAQTLVEFYPNSSAMLGCALGLVAQLINFPVELVGAWMFTFRQAQGERNLKTVTEFPLLYWRGAEIYLGNGWLVFERSEF